MLDEENSVIAGVIGSLIGAAIGIGIWTLIGMFGKFALIGGLFLCLGVFGGYILLGKGISKIGIIICAVVLIVSVYIAVRCSYAAALCFALHGEKSFGECMSTMNKLLATASMKKSFIKDLGLGYLMTLGGGVVLLYKLGVMEDL